MSGDDGLERPYGQRRETGPKSELVRIKPGCCLGMADDPEHLGPHDLRNTGVSWERVRFVGFVDNGGKESHPLRYRFLPSFLEGEGGHYDNAPDPIETKYGPGSVFYSVFPTRPNNRGKLVYGKGYFHDLYNTDPEGTIELEIEWERL